MLAPTAEMTLRFITLILLFMSLSCLKLRYERSGLELIQEFFRLRIEQEGTAWKVIYLLGRHIHIVFLFSLFLLGFQNMYCARSLGYMFFYIIYTSSEWLYRHTNACLVLFSCFFIWG